MRLCSRFSRRRIPALIAGAISGLLVAAAPPNSRYDGFWAVDVIVQTGTCSNGFSFPIRVSNGTIVYNGQVQVVATGNIAPNGQITAVFNHNNEALRASGRISQDTGVGTWSAPSRECSGRWEARKQQG